ncbi:hypothetical protein O53_247 [Microcystis aeruginosa TAIHU98]|uniref:Uncharacterized protein n=1 Tax=Microcystis aeruginosa TAIHU98 TaxID=1134457 RepID=L7E869_MICAE|nr:hypothetical protein O53_247 [Microcystis aeruginosa TAIHU98]
MLVGLGVGRQESGDRSQEIILFILPTPHTPHPTPHTPHPTPYTLHPSLINHNRVAHYPVSI